MKKRQLSHTLERILYNSKKTVKIILISFSLIFSLSCNLNKGIPKNDEDNSISFNTIKVNNIELGNGQIGANPNDNMPFIFATSSSPMAVSQNNEVIFSINYEDLKIGPYQRTANNAFSPIHFENIPNTIFKVYSLTTFRGKIYAIINIETLFGNNIFSGVYELIPSQNIFSLVKKANENITFYQFLEHSNKTSGEITSLYISSIDNQDKYNHLIYRFPDFKNVSPKIKDSQGNIKNSRGLMNIVGEELGEVIYFMGSGDERGDVYLPFLTSSTISRREPITIDFKDINSNGFIYITAVGQAMVNNNLSYIASTTQGYLYKLPPITESLKVINLDQNNPDFLINYSNNRKGYVNGLKVVNNISYALAHRGTYQLNTIGKKYEPINSIDSFDIKNYNGIIYLLGGEKGGNPTINDLNTYYNAQILKQLPNKTWQRVL